MENDISVWLDTLDDEGIERLRSPIEIEPVTQNTWFELFRYDRYNWSDAGFLRRNRGKHAWMPIRLTQGYFMIVSKGDYLRMTRFPDGSPKTWCLKVDYDEEGTITKLYARRRGRGREPKTVYAHRELLYALEKRNLVDHKNGWGLDNRRGTPTHPINLCNTHRSANGHNMVRTRSKHVGLPPGVERRGNRFGGIRSKRISRRKVVTIRSKRSWKTPEPAARWYLNQIKRKCGGRSEWAHDPMSVNYPAFPPFLARDICVESTDSDMHIPF